MMFNIPPRNSLPSSISEWCDDNNVKVVTSDIDPLYHPRKTEKILVKKPIFEKTCTKKNFNICSYQLAEEVSHQVLQIVKYHTH